MKGIASKKMNSNLLAAIAAAGFMVLMILRDHI